MKLNLQIPIKKSENTSKTATKTMNRRKHKIYFKHLHLASDPLGVGLTGKVYSAYHLESMFCVKVIDVSRRSSTQTADIILNVFKSMYNRTPQYCTSHKLSHAAHKCTVENVVSLHKLFYKHGTVFAVLDFMNAGSLHDLINILHNNNRTIIPEHILSSVIFQVVNGLISLHKPIVNNGCSVHSSGSCSSTVSDDVEGISTDDQDLIANHAVGHRDIKPSNILLDSEGTVKLQDSGARSIRNMFINEYTQKASTEHEYFQHEYGYLAPETMQGNTFTTKSDIWSLGVSLVECCLGHFPISFHGSSVFSKIVNFTGSLQSEEEYVRSLLGKTKTSEELFEFISKCLRKNPEERPTAEDLLTFDFLKQHNTDLISARETVRKWLLTLLFPIHSSFPLLHRELQQGKISDIEIITVVSSDSS